MSYTFLLEQGAESSAEYFADIPASVLWKLNLTAGVHSSSDNETEYYRTSRSGMISAPLTEDHGGGLSMSSAADSPAKESVSPETEPDSTTKNPDCGGSRLAPYATFDPVTCSLKTRQLSLFGEGCELLATLPRWGMIVAGELYPLPTPSGLLEHRAWIISASASGSLVSLPTPRARESTESTESTETQQAREARGTKASKNLTSEVQKLRVPTPRSEDGQCSGGHLDKDDTLYGLICRPKRLPTPKGTASGPDFARVNREGSGGDDLATAIARTLRIPTPTRQDASNNCGPSQKDRDALNVTVGVALNPDWVEWLMGWPIGWTDLKQLEMAKFRLWLDSHGKF